jgi:hypothetical protein
VGLLVLRAVLAALPVLKNASIISDSLLSPLVIGNAILDTAILLAVLGFGLEVGRVIQANYGNLPELGKTVSLGVIIVVLLLAYQCYQLPTACLIETPDDLVNIGKTAPTGNPQNFADFLRVWNQAVQGVTTQAVHAATGDSLLGYQHLAVALLRQPPDLYGWTFLILIIIPVVGIALTISRNLDGFTELVFHAAAASRSTLERPVASVASAGSGDGSPHLSRSTNEMWLGDAVDKLIKLKELLDLGVISKEDFEAQKVAILQRSFATIEPDELRKLKSLLDAGALTPDEYEVQKQRFLSQL